MNWIQKIIKYFENKKYRIISQYIGNLYYPILYVISDSGIYFKIVSPEEFSKNLYNPYENYFCTIQNKFIYFPKRSKINKLIIKT